MELDLGDRDLIRPSRAAVCRPERRDRALEALEGHYHRAVGLNDWLAAEPLGVPGRRHRGAPSEAAVRRRAHVLEIALAEVVELRVAVAVKVASGRVVAGRPVLVEVDLSAQAAGSPPGSPKVAPSSVERLTKIVGTLRSRSSGIDEIEPHAVPRVVGDARVAHPLERAIRVAERARAERQSRQEARRTPGRSAVPRAHEADVRRAAVEEATDLERGHNRRAVSEGVGLDLRGMLARGVGERVRADLGHRNVCLGQRGKGEESADRERPAERCRPHGCAADHARAIPGGLVRPTLRARQPTTRIGAGRLIQPRPPERGPRRCRLARLPAAGTNATTASSGTRRPKT